MRIIHIVNKCTHTSIPIEMASKMSENNDVTVISLYDSNKKVEGILDKIAPNCTGIGCDFKKNPLKAIGIMRKVILERDYGIVQTHHALSGAIARVLAYKKKNIKIVHTVHANHHSFTWGQNWIIGRSLNRADAIVYNSKTTMGGLYGWQKRIAERKLNRVIYNGIDVGRIVSAENEYSRILFENNSISEEETVLLQVGRLEKVKNPETTVRAFINYLRKDNNSKVRLIIVGDGSERDNIKELAGKYLEREIIMTGTISRDQVYSLMKASDVIIVPSIYEGFCNALFEAMTSGLKLIISDIPVFSELVDENLPITRVSPENVEEVCDAIEHTIKSPLSNVERKNIEEYARTNYSIEKSVEQYLALYTDISCM